MFINDKFVLRSFKRPLFNFQCFALRKKIFSTILYKSTVKYCKVREKLIGVFTHDTFIVDNAGQPLTSFVIQMSKSKLYKSLRIS